jgi:hypothetical protein
LVLFFVCFFSLFFSPPEIFLILRFSFLFTPFDSFKPSQPASLYRLVQSGKKTYGGVEEEKKEREMKRN